MKWAATFSSIYYEQVALLHPPNRLASDETEEFLPKHVSTCLEGPYRKDSSGAHPCRAIDRVWEPRIPSPCSLKAITHAIGSKIGSSRSRWNKGIEYCPVGMKTHIEYHDIFFWKYNSPYHFEMGTYVLINLLGEGGSIAPAQPNSLRWNWGIFAQTCSTCLEGPYRKDSSGAHLVGR